MRHNDDGTLRDAVTGAFELAVSRHPHVSPDPFDAETWLRQYGRLGGATHAEMAARTVRQVVLPCARALIEETAPWLDGHQAAS